ncbi:hypothetical protein J437_LFUL016302 [Ladona fulva]|uniref:SET domain-containing protein n=1 Tax=Ladona fulva TaxID=123851 RepID=A0A8K0KNM5_LADFU|nr:hypothetical protein J437_LFUL016302 [Ladona fulva]
MVRGRRKVNRRKANLQCIEDNHDESFSDAPKVKDLKIEFQGKLSHASSISKDTRITKYFQQIPLDGRDVKPAEILSSDSFPSSDFRDTENLTEVTSTSNLPEESSKIKMNTPHKIQLPDLRSPLSPATTLSRLRNSGSPKKSNRAKGVRSRRRLNISQNQNQLIQTNNLNYVCCNVPNPKNPSSVPPQPPSENHKLTEYFPVRRSERKPKRTILEERQRDMEEAILSGREEGLEVVCINVQHFVGKGRGIVATRHFCKGEFVVEYAGELISMAEAKDREKKYAQDENTGCYMYYFKHHNQQYWELGQNAKMCKQCLSMTEGLMKTWKQPVAYYYVHGTYPTKALKSLLLEVVTRFQSCGLKVMATVRDQMSSNRAVIESLVKEHHINPSNCDKMGVRMAAQTMSSSVTGAIYAFFIVGDSEDLKSSTVHTAEFIGNVSNLFESFNSAQDSSAYKPLSVDATAESGRLGRLVNHSRNGNLTTKTVVVKSNPHLVLIAKEDIYPSDEILYDYGDRSKESLKHHPWLSL